jgi:hypothetical protein
VAGPPPATRPSRGEPAIAPASRLYRWWVRVTALAILVLIVAYLLTTHAPPSRGIAQGQPLPKFSVPSAAGQLNKDPLTATDQSPGQVDQPLACQLPGRGWISVCALDQKAPLVLVLFVNDHHCAFVLDDLERMRSAFPGLDILAVALRGQHGRLQRTIRNRHWQFPIGYDRNGVLASIYKVGVCPQLELTYPVDNAGVALVAEPPVLGRPSGPRLIADLEELYVGAEHRGWLPPGAAPGGAAAPAAGAAAPTASAAPARAAPTRAP